ncbi:MAG: DEAD/DEAH box helicase [Carboxydocellales bacterium]
MTNLARFKKGNNVRIISCNKVGTINEVLIRQSNVGYRVTVDGKTTTYQEKYLESYVDEEQGIIDGLSLGDFVGPNDFHLFQTWYRLKRPIEGNFYSYLASRTVFNPYQFKPLSKFLSPGSEERLFIADEVGVGKTIETGIILTELIARGELDRRSPILIVCPNALGPKWVKEMNQRFNLKFHLHDGSSLKNSLVNVLNTGYMPDSTMWSVASIQLLRHHNYFSLLQKIDGSREVHLWSMVVIDEAHHMRNNNTESNYLGNVLSSLSEKLVMLSATPLNLKDEDLFSQLHILNPAMFPDLQTFSAMLSPVKAINRSRRLLAENSTVVYGDILKEIEELRIGPLGSAINEHAGVASFCNVLSSGNRMGADEVAKYERMLISLSPLDNSFTRTLKREALKHRVTRETIKVPVELNPAEMEFHEAVIQLTKDAYLARGGNPLAIGFITNTPRRMVSSCIPAMREYLEWCIRNDQMITDEAESRETVDDDSELPKVPLPPELRSEYIRLRDLAGQLGTEDTKYEEFSKLIKQLFGNLDNPQVMVFSFFVRTLKYLKQRLTAEGYRVGLICGEVPLVGDGRELGRYDIMEDFEKKDLDILLSSEVGGEGLDFQFCQAMVNYDLPYNPMRIEQRIGRIDRFGQNADKVIAANMYIRNTVDERIYAALYERIGLIEESVGTLEPILGDQLTGLQREIVSGQLSTEQLEIRMKEIELAIAQAKLEMEKFETNRRELMGDEYFTSPLHNLEGQSDFVLPGDAARLTAICLESWEGCNYKGFDENRGVISLSREIRAGLEQYTRRPGSEGCMYELKSLLIEKASIPVVFNGSLADQHKDHFFLAPCGFWTKFLLSEIERRQGVQKVFSLSNSYANTMLVPGVYIIPMFEVRIEGFRVEIDLAAVPVKIPEKSVVDLDYRKFSRTFGRNVSNKEPVLDPMVLEELPDYLNRGRDALEVQIEEKLELLRAENKYHIEARISSLKRGSEIRRERLQKRITDHCARNKDEGRLPSQDFIRLTEAQIAVEARRTEDKINKLRDKSDLAFNSSLVGIVLLTIADE